MKLGYDPHITPLLQYDSEVAGIEPAHPFEPNCLANSPLHHLSTLPFCGGRIRTDECQAYEACDLPTGLPRSKCFLKLGATPVKGATDANL